MKNKNSLLVILLFIGCQAFSQRRISFPEGLFADIPAHYGREAIYTDPLAWQLAAGTLASPAENGDSAKGLVWKKIIADSTGTLSLHRGRGDFRRTGYFFLSYQSPSAGNALLHILGNSACFFNGVEHAGDVYSSGWLYIPVKVRKGVNQIFVRGTRINAELIFPIKDVTLQTEDATMPTVRSGIDKDSLLGAVVIVNNRSRALSNLQLITEANGSKRISRLPAIPAGSIRKVPFIFSAQSSNSAGKLDIKLTLMDNRKLLDTASVIAEVVEKDAQYARTFVSNIDGSLQYFAVVPRSGTPTDSTALVLTVHGAGVEAIGQARAYRSKDWVTIVAATNRRPRGFNWEDWGRLDALEVLDTAKKIFHPDPSQIYLTGHSMGGHGTWFLGATYPDHWAAIAPSAGYASLKEYGSADGLIPDTASTQLARILLRAGNQSDVNRLVKNYRSLGVYVLHGDSDETVPVRYARQMRQILGTFHPDMAYYEYPGGSHWYGNQCVDWDPIFNFFGIHRLKLDSAVTSIDFTTSNPGVSASDHWASIIQQETPLEYSRLQLTLDKKLHRLSGSTDNVHLLSFDLSSFASGDSIQIALDKDSLHMLNVAGAQTVFLMNTDGKWLPAAKAPSHEKNPLRYGTFKDAFRHRMIFVYATGGTPRENAWSRDKARFDAETWYYRGNGAVDLIADRDFDAARFHDRGVILYGSRSSNQAWPKLLSGCPIQVFRDRVEMGSEVIKGNDLGAYFVWPRDDSKVASVAVIAGTGDTGMQAAMANQYFAGGSGFPDYMIFRAAMMKTGAAGVERAGFFNNRWELK